MGAPLVRMNPESLKVGTIESPIDQQKRALSLRTLLDEQRQGQQTIQMNDLKLQEAKRAQAEQAALQQVYTEVGGDIEKTLQLAPSKGVSIKTITDLQDKISQYKKSKLDLSHAEWTAEQDKNKDIAQALDAVVAVPEDVQPAAWDRAVQGLQAKGRLTPEEAQQYSQYPGVEGIKNMSLARKSSEQINQQIDNERADAAEKQRIANEKEMAKPVSVRERENDYHIWLQGREPNAALEMEHKKLWDAEQLKQKQSANTINLSSDAVEMAAQNYVLTGTMPALGMGSPVIRQQILNRAGEIASGKGAPATGAGAVVAANKAGFASDTAALIQLQKTRAAVGAFENTALSNLKLFEDAAGKIVDSGSAWINRPLRSIARGGLGSAEQSAYDAAYRIAITEIARVVANPNLVGVLSDNARREMEVALDPDATFKQILSATKILRQDMANRKGGLDSEISNILGRIRGGGSGGTSTPTGERKPLSDIFGQ